MRNYGALFISMCAFTLSFVLAFDVITAKTAMTISLGFIGGWNLNEFVNSGRLR